MDHLRSKRRMRRSRHASEHGHSRGRSSMPSQFESDPRRRKTERFRPLGRRSAGRWKEQLYCDVGERHSRFLMLIKVPSKDTAVVVAALSKRVRKLPATLRRSLTWDRGLEMAKHKAFTVATDVQVYFCDPQSPWRVARTKTPICSCDNTSREEPTSSITQAQLDQVELRLNQRPRKTLGFQTPASKLQASVASTV